MAIYTHVGQRALEAFLKDYDVGSALSFKGIAEGVENSNYLLRTDAGDFILTLYEERMRSEDLPFVLGLMNHLRDKGFRCARVHARRDGGLFGELEGRPTTLTSFLEGVSLGKPSPEHSYEVGGSLARMHLRGADYKARRLDPVPYRDWARLFASCDVARAGLASGAEAAEIVAEIKSDLAEILPLWPSDLPEGAAHGDLFPDNVLFRGMEAGFIDFSFANTNYWAADLAICMNAWGFEEEGDFLPDHLRSLIEGYHAERGLSDEEWAALALLGRAAAMQFFLMRLYARSEGLRGDALVRLKEPRHYLKRLRFHRSKQSLADYGLPPQPPKKRQRKARRRVDIYTDGSCLGNPGPGGWGAVILREGAAPQEISGGDKATTNNRMEMLAVIHALEKIPDADKVALHTDSRYVYEGITRYLNDWKARGWRTSARKPVKNEDLWRRLDEASAKLGDRLEFRWVEAHAGEKWNERADQVARAAVPKARLTP